MSPASAIAALLLFQSDPTPEQIAWVKAHAIPLVGVEAGHGFDDLDPLADLIGDARIVALGECTHGSREVFQMKHRLVEFLASELGFTIFSIEASTPESYRVNDYVSHGQGDPASLIRGMYFWTWSTSEVLDMVRWMHDFNEAGENHIDFTGFDMQTPDVAQRIVVDYLGRIDPEAAESARKAYATPAGTARGSSADFGVATGSFPLERCKGKKIKYTGWIKTEGWTGGHAGLWWRVDGSSKTIRFDNMSDRGPSGDSDWRQYTIELDVPAEAVNINFGVLAVGTGTAWFDTLAVEIDGQSFNDHDQLDLDFESPELVGFVALSPSYSVGIDRAHAHSGQQSLRIAKRAQAPAPKVEADPQERIRQVEAVVAKLEAARPKLVGASSDKDFEWALHNADIVAQCARMNAEGASGRFVRDECMARNVKWILDHNPSAKIVLWAHNGHVARMEGAMGSHLAKMYGKSYVVLGFATHEGEYTAMAQGKGLVRDNKLVASAKGSVEAVLHAAGLPIAIVDLRSASAEDRASAFLAAPTLLRSIGALAQTQQFFPVNASAAYDALIWIEKTSASRELPK